MFRVIVMLFLFGPRIRDVINIHRQPDRFRRCFDQVGDLIQRELFSKLIENTELSSFCRIKGSELDASQRIADIQITTSLAALAVYSKRKPAAGLHNETVDYRSKNIVVMKARVQLRMHPCFIRVDAVNDARCVLYQSSLLRCQYWECHTLPLFRA